MRIEIEIPDKDIPQRQDSIDIHMSFIDGKVCGCDYPFTTIAEEEKTKAVAIDKIRAEIMQLRLHKAEFLTSDNKVCIDSQEVLDIIDKYKAESEGEK